MKKTTKEKYKPFTQCIPQPKPELADKELLAAIGEEDNLFEKQITVSYINLDANTLAAWRKEFGLAQSVISWDVNAKISSPIVPRTTRKLRGFTKAK